MRFNTIAAAGLFLALAPLPALAAEAPPPKTGNAVIDRMAEIVVENFYDAGGLDRFREAAGLVATSLPDIAAADPGVVGDAIDYMLESLETSHTARYAPDDVDYYELTDIFRFAVRDSLRRLFPPQGDVVYDGIGIATATIDGKTFIADVYDGGPAARSGLAVGDEIVAVDAAPFAEIDSFKGKAGGTATVAVRRADGADPVAVGVSVESIQPTDMFLAAIRSSATVIERDGFRIGYLRIWAYAARDTSEVIAEALAGPLADVDGLVLDLRGRWGGAPADAVDMFVGGAPDVAMQFRGDRELTHLRWRKPVIAVVDGGTRSGLEIFAYGLKSNGVTLVGAPTAGAVVAGRGYMLPDDSLMVLAVADVFVDGGRLEGVGVAPDIAVPFDLPYAGGADPQKEAALDAMAANLSRGDARSATTP